MTFEAILQMRQEELKRELERLLCGQGYDVINRPGFLYARIESRLISSATLPISGI